VNPVFQAVSEPTRRSLLGRLRDEGELSLAALAAPLPMSRQAVTKHLEALQDAGLVEVEWRGRTKLHRLNAEPLRAVSDWLSPYAAAWDRRLHRLRRHLEANE
jgi:DNA-binding transcriptional ArsR family regulator